MDIINSLFKSKIRRKILTCFFADENRKYYINELARLIDTSQGTCRRELNKLAGIGIFKTLRTGNLLYYSIDKKSLFYKEFRSIIGKTLGIEIRLKNSLEKIEGIDFAFIFGSYAKRQLTPASDIDLVIVGRIKEEKLSDTLKKEEKIISREINYHIYSKSEFKSKMENKNSFIKNILKNYILILGDDDDFKQLLEKT